MGLLDGKTALVTGVANRWSIATGIARKFHEHGAKLAFIYQGERVKDEVEKLAAELGGGKAYSCDVSSDEADLGMVRRVLGSEDHLSLATCGRMRIVRIDKDEIEDVRTNMLVQHSQVVVYVVAFGLPFLRRKVADVHLECRRSLDRLDHSLYEQVGKDRRVKRAWADDDELRIHDRL